MGGMSGDVYMGGTRKTYISSAKIRKMKANMKKVPKIQEKAKQYFDQEEKMAEDWFDEHLKKI